jgi:hypothetical protein
VEVVNSVVVAVEETGQTVVDTALLVTTVMGLVVYGQLVTVGAQDEMVSVSVL